VNLWTILGWILYGLIRFVFVLIPYVKAPGVYRGAPSQWYRYNTWSDWGHHDDDDGRPDEHWCRAWLEMAFGELAAYAVDKARPYVDQVKSLLLSVIGYIKGGFSSMGAWVNWLQRAVGDAVPYFAANLAGCASWLYFRLPAEIRQGWRSWSDIWEWIRESVRSWARVRYDAAKSWAFNAVNWVNSTGDQLRRWRDSVAGVIDQIRHDPYGWITGRLGWAWAWLAGFASNGRDTVLGWLGPEWPGLVTFSRDCVSFYYNLWSAGWRVLGDFVADPKAFLMDRLEQAVLDRW